MKDIKISVIIPVYNAEKFIERAVESVLIQPEVDEIILIDDGSSDRSYEIIQDIASKNKIFKTLMHTDRINKGSAATRNLGILTAKNEWIAFLDADDYYLKNRFKKAIQTISENADCDGVYEAVSPEEDIKNPIANKIELFENITVKEGILPDNLFFKLAPIGKAGMFSCNGLTIKKNKVIECQLFDTSLRIAEDMLLWMKLSIASNLCGGSLTKPVAVFVRHANNTTFGGKVAHHLIPAFFKLLNWSHPKFNRKHKNIVCDRLLYSIAFYQNKTSKLQFLMSLIKLSAKVPSFVFSIYFLNNIKFFLKYNFDNKEL
jgi:glycosyltransferase involved in cell wall biosynthesis